MCHFVVSCTYPGNTARTENLAVPIRWGIIVALLILGAALASAAMRSFQGASLWSYGPLCLFAGGFQFLDTVNISFLNELIVFNTYGKLLCGILVVYFGQLCLRNARERLRAMVGGTLAIQSTPGQGTTGEIRIPRGDRL